MRLLVAGLLALTLAGSAVAQSRAPGLRPPSDTAEAGLWAQSERMENAAEASGIINRDPALRAYVQGVACKVGPEYCSDIRAKVMDVPFFNASMAPNGYMEVFSGALLRVADEDELAFILGHEVTHFAENHQIERWNNLKVTATTMLVVGAAVGAAGVYYGVDTSSLIDLSRFAGLAAIFSYDRRQETEADRLGYERAVAGGYAPGAGAQLWQAIIEETAASDFPKVRKAGARAGIFNSHPIEAERVAALRKLAADRASTADREAGRLRLRAAIRPHLARWLREDLRRRDYGQTLLIISRLEAKGEDLGVLEFYRGEVFRQRRGEGDFKLARDAYDRAATHADSPVDAWRELGEMNRRIGDKDRALAAYRTYLQRAPQADDAWLVEDAIKALEGHA